MDGQSIPRLNASASVDKQRALHLSICNAHPSASAELSCLVRGMGVSQVKGRVLTGTAITTHNTFAAPDAVKPKAFDDVSVRGDTITIRLPPKSITVLEVR
jgi:alpha-N-arabinofuranosidase